MFFLQEPELLELLPELKICSDNLYLSGVEHNIVCDLVNTALSCWIQVSDSTITACQVYVIYGPFNYI